MTHEYLIEVETQFTNISESFGRVEKVAYAILYMRECWFFSRMDDLTEQDYLISM